MTNFFKVTLLSSALLGASLGVASAQGYYAPGPGPVDTLGAIVTAPLAIVGAPFGAGPVYEGRSAYEGPMMNRRPTEPSAFFNGTDETGHSSGLAENPRLGQ